MTNIFWLLFSSSYFTSEHSCCSFSASRPFASPSLVPRTPVILHGGAQRARRDPPPTSDSESPSSDLPAPTPALRLRLVPTIRLRLLLAPAPPGSDHLTPSPSGLRLLDSFSLWLNHSAAAPPPSRCLARSMDPHLTSHTSPRT